MGGVDLNYEYEKKGHDMETGEDDDQFPVWLSYTREKDTVHTVSQAADRQGDSSTGEQTRLLRFANITLVSSNRNRR